MIPQCGMCSHSAFFVPQWTKMHFFELSGRCSRNEVRMTKFTNPCVNRAKTFKSKNGNANIVLLNQRQTFDKNQSH